MAALQPASLGTAGLGRLSGLRWEHRDLISRSGIPWAMRFFLLTTSVMPSPLARSVMEKEAAFWWAERISKHPTTHQTWERGWRHESPD